MKRNPLAEKFIRIETVYGDRLWVHSEMFEDAKRKGKTHTRCWKQKNSREPGSLHMENIKRIVK